MYRLTNKKGNETTMRIVRDDNNTYVGCIGTVKDLSALDLLIGNYPSDRLDKWLLINGKDSEEILEFNSKDEIKTHLGIKETLTTPRGTFKIRFTSIKEANDNGFQLWFTHDGYQIVGNGTHAYAVEKH